LTRVIEIVNNRGEYKAKKGTLHHGKPDAARLKNKVIKLYRRDDFAVKSVPAINRPQEKANEQQTLPAITPKPTRGYVWFAARDLLFADCRQRSGVRSGA